MAGESRNYYEILGVERDASDREIKHAYRVLARRMHPDVCREEGAEERFKGVNEAFRVLSDPEERGRYDVLGHDGYTRFGGGSGGSPGPGPAGDFRGFGDAFDLFFSAGSWGPAAEFRPRPGSDILVQESITLEEAILGCDREVDVPFTTRCGSCGGTGSATRKAPPCPVCGGTGREEGGAPGGPAGPALSPCRECGGRGRIPEEPCDRCGGWGATQGVRKVKVRIPPGIDTGMRIRKAGLGKEGDPEIPDGDLFIEVAILPHGRFTRKGDDLETLVHLSPAKAVLGSSIEVETVDGRTLRVEIPPGVQPDGIIRVPGEGVTTRERRGNLIIRVGIRPPETVSDREKALYVKLFRIGEERAGGKDGRVARYVSRIRDRGR